MSKPLSLFRSAIWNLLTVFVLALAGFLIVPVIIRNLGSESFGIYTIILMIGGFAGMQSLGLGEATLKYVAQYYGRSDIQGINRVVGATLTVYSFSGILVSGLIVVLAGDIITWFNISPENVDVAVDATRIAGFAFFLNVFSSTLKTIPEAVQRYDVLNKYTLIMVVSKYTAMYLIARGDAGIVGLTYLILVFSFIDTVVYYFLAKFLVKGIKCFPNFDKGGIKEVFSYGIFSFINDLIQKSALYIDQIILGKFYSATAVAFLTAPKDLITKAQGLTGAVGKALFPRFSSMEEGEEMQKLYITSLWILTIVSLVVFVPLAMVIPSFLAIWISPEFSRESSEFAVLFSFGVALNGGVAVYQALLKGTGRIRWLTKIISTLTIFSFLITAILVYKFGLIGAGIRVIIFSWVGIALCFYVGKKVFPSFPLSKEIVQTAVLPVIVSYLFFFFGEKLFSMYIFDSWPMVIIGYLSLIVVLIVLLLTANFIFFRTNGVASSVLLYVSNLYKSKLKFMK